MRGNLAGSRVREGVESTRNSAIYRDESRSGRFSMGESVIRGGGPAPPGVRRSDSTALKRLVWRGDAVVLFRDCEERPEITGKYS